MPGLSDSLDIAARALQAQQQGVEVASHNLANANNPAYARQKLVLQTNPPTPSGAGPEGTGVDAVAIQQCRDSLLDQQIQGETSITSYLQSQQSALESVQGTLGEQIQGDSTAASGASGANNVGATGGLASDLSALFNSFQTLSASPGSLTNRQAVITSAQDLASQFNQVSTQLTQLQSQLNQSVQSGVASANQLLSDIADLNGQIQLSEAASGGSANDLRDQREQKLEDLSKLVNMQSATQPDGTVSVTLGGQLLVSETTVQSSLQAIDSGGGQLVVGAAGTGAALTLTSGSIQGTIEARDGALSSLHTSLNTLATQLISSVNAAYSGGYDLNGGTGAALFNGTNAGDITLSASLANNPSALQAAGVSGNAGDNQVALAVAQLANQNQAGLGNQTFSQSYGQTVAAMGSALSSVNSQLNDQQVVQNALTSQRNSVSGVSVDEEMTNLMTYQRAYEASAHLVSTVNNMFSDLMAMTSSS